MTKAPITPILRAIHRLGPILSPRNKTAPILVNNGAKRFNAEASAKGISVNAVNHDKIANPLTVPL